MGKIKCIDTNIYLKMNKDRVQRIVNNIKVDVLIRDIKMNEAYQERNNLKRNLFTTNQYNLLQGISNAVEEYEKAEKEEKQNGKLL